LVAEGLKNREIAEVLSLSEHTVKNHLFRVFEKLGISNRAELILYLLGNNGLNPTLLAHSGTKRPAVGFVTAPDQQRDLILGD
jgi:hypothetical protein